jgi:hypothetical protein
MWLVTVAIVVPVTLFVLPRNVLAVAGVAGIVGAGVPTIRLAVWHRRHPRISPEEWRRGMAERAPWN